MEVPLDQKVLAAVERIARGRRALLQQQADSAGVTPLQADVLVLLDAGIDTAAEVAVRLDVAASTVADALAALRRKALVTETRDPTDGRLRRLAFTDAGRTVCRGRAAAAAPLRGVLAGLPEEAKGQALAVLIELIAGLQREGIVAVDRSCATCRFRIADGSPVGYCAVLDQPLTPPTLRVDCPEHEAVPTQG